MKSKKLFLYLTVACFLAACQPKDEVKVWKQIKAELVDTGAAIYVENPNYNEDGTVDKKVIEMSYYDGCMDNGAEDTEAITTYVGIDATNLEDVDYQYAFYVVGANTDSYGANMTMGLLNKRTGEFVFSTVGQDCYYRAEVYGKSQFEENQTFSTGEEYKVAAYMITDSGNFQHYYTGENPANHWQYQMYVQFTHEMDKKAMNDFEKDFVWFVTSCSRQTYEENFVWYYENSFHTVDDFYKNLYRFFDIESDIVFFEPRIVNEQNP